MLIMEPDGSISACAPAPAAAAGEDATLEHVLMLTEELGYDIAREVRVKLDARLAALAERLGPLTSAGFGLALG